MVAPVIGTTKCLGCDKMIQLRKGLTVKYCSVNCGNKHRNRSPERAAKMQEYRDKKNEREKQDRLVKKMQRYGVKTITIS